MDIGRNEHEKEIVRDLEAMTEDDSFWPRVLAKAVLRIWLDLRVENDALRKQVQTAKDIANRGIDIMTPTQIGRWEGVRAFLEQGEDAYTEAE